MEDIPNLQLIFADPEAMKYYKSTKTIEQTAKWIEWQEDMYSEHGHGLWAVHLKETDEFIGQCGLVRHAPRGVEEDEIGYLFVREYWGNGYATEAAARVRDYAFEELGKDTVVVYMGPENLPSRKVAKKIGGRLEEVVPADKMKWGEETCVYRIDN